jgi:hypothetical protein
MNKQKCKYTMKRLFTGAMLYEITETHTCTGVVALTYTSIVVLTYCRMEMWIYFNIETCKYINKLAMKRIYKSLIIHLLKDSNQ